MMATPSSDGGVPARQARSFMAELGERLIDNGYPILPIMPGTKSPGKWSESRLWQGYKDWSKHCTRPTKPFELDIWRRWPGCGIGIACGLLVGVDLDLLHEEAALSIERKAFADLGDTPCVRIGRAPKRLLVYRADEPFRPIKRHPLEILATGSQFVAYAVHPDTDRPYFWPHEGLDEVPVSRLPVVTEDQCRRFLEGAYAMVPAELRQSTLGPDRSADYYYAGGELRGTMAAISAAMVHIPNSDVSYDDWIKVGYALKGALGEQGLDLFATWSARSAKDQPDFTLKTWRSLKPERIGAGTIYYYGQCFGWVPEHDMVLNGALEQVAETGAGSELIAALTAKANGLPPHDPETGEVLEPAEPTPGSLPVVVGEQYRGLPRREMLVKGLLGAGELSVTYGAPKTGKSFLLTDLALSIACGDGAWFGHRIKRPGLVIYCIMEGAGGFPNRLAAWSEHTGRTVPNSFAYVPVRLRFLAPEGAKTPFQRARTAAEDIVRLKRLVAEVEAQAGRPCVLLVIDTVARAMTGRDENDTQDMGEFVDACGELQNLPNRPHVALVHHESKSGTMRGSSALLGAGDTMLRVQRTDSGRQWAVEFSKDDADGEDHAFDLVLVEIGQDEDGDPITSCVIVDEGRPTPKAKTKPPSNTEKALTALSRAIATAGIEPPAGFEIPVKYVVSGDFWRCEANRTMAGETPESRAAAFRNARKKLFDDGLVAGAGQFVWLADPGAQSAAQMLRETRA